jgi:hypothetical protein
MAVIFQFPNCFSTVNISSVSIRVNPWLHSSQHSAALCLFLFTCVHVPILKLSYGSCHCEILHHSFTRIARLSDRLTINGLPPSIGDANGVAGGIVEVVGDRVVGVGLVEAIAGDVISFV